MTQASALYAGSLMHLRLRPRRHLLRYRMYSVLLDLDALPATAAPLRLFSLNRFNLFSFHERDHGAGDNTGLSDWVRGRLREAGLPHDGRILLFAMPRVMGYVFNPLSVYFCHDTEGALRAILYEVNNTFGERHGYLLEVAQGQRGGQAVRQHSAKRFHVSPFLQLDMEYRFRVLPPTPTRPLMKLLVDVHDADGRTLVAEYGATRRTLDDANLLRLFFSHPLLTFKVIAGIHWEALRLWLKGVKVINRPAEAPVAITVLRAEPEGN
ncbi:DUF1365 domain-containing protein [Uliginosibacterium sp. H1]|uniref:DUF1365 domain-containing protein n=1 Tax=Uliginosibacterium sp. H1 TaxID=3114757 RepID=UPI002E179D84|nr:DUF1365 domain-containing protein [Uliginosibacterium sp. H1]